ncbi:hypothetical protein ACIPSA_16360 [Streptomyces sp. NPDC086549]
MFIAIERHPARAERLRELERIVDAGEQDPWEYRLVRLTSGLTR